MHHYACANKSMSHPVLEPGTVLLTSWQDWGFHEPPSFFTSRLLGMQSRHVPQPLLQAQLHFPVYPAHPRASGTAFWNRCILSVFYSTHMYLSIRFGWTQQLTQFSSVWAEERSLTQLAYCQQTVPFILLNIITYYSLSSDPYSFRLKT